MPFWHIRGGTGSDRFEVNLRDRWLNDDRLFSVEEFGRLVGYRAGFVRAASWRTGADVEAAVRICPESGRLFVDGDWGHLANADGRQIPIGGRGGGKQFEECLSAASFRYPDGDRDSSYPIGTQDISGFKISVFACPKTYVCAPECPRDSDGFRVPDAPVDPFPAGPDGIKYPFEYPGVDKNPAIQAALMMKALDIVRDVEDWEVGNHLHRR